MSIKLNHAIQKAVKLGLFHQVPSGQLMALLHIVALSDDSGVVKITHTRLAEITGRTRKTIAGDIKTLEQIKYNNEPLLKKMSAVVADKTVEVIKIHPAFLSEVVIGDNKAVNVEVFIEDINDNKLTAKEIAKLFAKTYQDEFGVSYVINWSRDIPVIKKGLLGKFSDDELLEIVEVAVHDYPKRWAKRDYPRPTITMLSNWLAKRAAEVVSEKRKDAKALAHYKQERQQSSSAVNDKLKKLFGE